MGRSAKYGLVVEATDAGFAAQVVRHRTSQGNTIEEERDGFSGEADAAAWGQAALAEYLAARRGSNAQKRQNRRARREHEAWLDVQPLQTLAELSGADNSARSVLDYRADLLWQEVAFRALKRGLSGHEATAVANKVVGKNWRQRLAKAMSGDLDHVTDATADRAMANASWLLMQGHRP
jgi:Protein of unknown function (DUF3622)